MSSREVEVAVEAEGVEDAAGEFPGGEGGGMPDVGGRDGGGGGRMGGKLLTRLVGLLALLGPILDVLGVVSSVLEAFVAPLAVVLLRLLQPVLRQLIRFLPAWLSLFQTIEENTAMLGAISVALFPILLGIQAIESILSEFWAWVTSLPQKIGQAIDRNLPQTAQALAGDGNLRRALAADFGDGSLPGDAQLREAGIDTSQGDTNVILEGGLGAFVDQVTQDSSVDWP